MVAAVESAERREELKSEPSVTSEATRQSCSRLTDRAYAAARRRKRCHSISYARRQLQALVRLPHYHKLSTNRSINSSGRTRSSRARRIVSAFFRSAYSLSAG